MKLPRLTTRRIMLIILACSLTLGFGLPAWEVIQNRETHVHVWIDKLDRDHPIPTVPSTGDIWINKPIGQKRPEIVGVLYRIGMDDIPIPFWPRYLKHIRGLPWKMQKGCRPQGTQIELLCELEHPEVCYRAKPGVKGGLIFSMSPPLSIQMKRNRLEAESNLP